MTNFSRRNFLATASLATLATTAFGSIANTSNQQAPKQKLMHQVYYWLKNPDSEEDKQKLIKGLHELVTVKEIKYSHIGVPQVFKSDDPQKNYHISLLMVFDEPKGIDDYHKDDIHQKFVKECAGLWSKTIKFDALAV
ncbi:MAG: Dabb family protein [Deinococcales bacterium]|nr:Dabb family protein [Chitinophagaceae bacterium]